MKFHHTTEEYFGALRQAGFLVDDLREGRPRREFFLHEETYRRRLRIPLFLIVSAHKRN